MNFENIQAFSWWRYFLIKATDQYIVIIISLQPRNSEPLSWTAEQVASDIFISHEGAGWYNFCIILHIHGLDQHLFIKKLATEHNILGELKISCHFIGLDNKEL